MDIGGRRHLNLVCTGRGSPTVIFLQGAGGDITDWLAQRSTRGESIVVANAHHFIQLDRPDAVVVAIRKVVEEFRR